jgi:predicted negative regulator of RcsB-dependent stress response
MKILFGAAVLLLVLILGVGFYQGWFYFSTNSAGDTSSATITVDKDKFHADEQKAKDKVNDIGQKAK